MSTRVLGMRQGTAVAVLILAAATLAIHPQAAPGQQAFAAPQGRIDNVRFEQAAGGRIQVFYDLVASDPRSTFSVGLEVSADGGQTFTVKPSTLSGDVGPGVAPGAGKRIVWDAGKDVESVQVNQFRFRVVTLAGYASPVSADSDGKGAGVVPSADSKSAVKRGGSPLKWVLPAAGGAAAVGVLAAKGGSDPPPPCGAPSFSSTAVTVPASGGSAISSGVVASCNWTASASQSWIQLTTPSGSGNGSVVFNVSSNYAPNAGSPARTANVTLSSGANTLVVTQDAASCGYTAEFHGGGTQASVGSGGGDREINVLLANSACQWTAVSDSSWVHLTPTGIQTGNGLVRVRVDQVFNQARQGIVTIGGIRLTINQLPN